MGEAVHIPTSTSAGQPAELPPPIPSLLRSQTLAEQAYSAIRASIWSGGIAPNTYYSEIQLAGVLGIWRTPVREALIRLVREGLVEVAPDRGFRLRLIARQESHEAVDLQEVTEEFVVRRLAINVSDDDIAHLEEILDRQALAIDDPSRFVAGDEEFHLALPELLQLERTRGLLLTLRGILWLSGPGSHASADQRSGALADHHAIVDALATRDPEQAARALQRHLLAARRLLAELDESPTGTDTGTPITGTPINR